jgi:hypothetical protein
MKITEEAEEFVRCAKAGLAFVAGYKAGERYTLGTMEAEHAKAIDAEAWQAGFDLADKRYAARYSPLKARTTARTVDDIIGPDGLTERERRIDPNPAHWKHPQGAPTDDTKDTNIP